jgi:hypothetical protein
LTCESDGSILGGLQIDRGEITKPLELDKSSLGRADLLR